MYNKNKQRNLIPNLGFNIKILNDKKGLIIMKTCYGGYCYEHMEDSDFNLILSSPIKPFLVIVGAVLTLAIIANF